MSANQWKCIPCIIDRKVAEAAPPGTVVLPMIRPAVAILNAQSVCLDHITIQRQSGVVGPNGQPVQLGLGG
jgi:hypothetical protein